MSNSSISHEASHNIIDFNENDPLLHRFYEVLLVLDVMNRHRNPSTYGLPTPEADDDPKKLHIFELRREYTRHLAYLCSFDTGGATVAAIVLQETEEDSRLPIPSPGRGITYLLATNALARSPHILTNWGADGSDGVRKYLVQILERLRRCRMKRAPPKQTEKKLISEAVRFSEPKLEKYMNFLAKEVSWLLENSDLITTTEGDINMPQEELHALG
jgi:hypothetical protein